MDSNLAITKLGKKKHLSNTSIKKKVPERRFSALVITIVDEVKMKSNLWLREGKKKTTKKKPFENNHKIHIA